MTGSEEPRRSRRVTKGLHKYASSSPAARPNPAKSAKSKPAKEAAAAESEVNDNEEDNIRCICANDNPKTRRAFIGCDACGLWQHNVCMGMPDDEDDVPDHYFCQECGPDMHQETLQAMSRGGKIWKTRSKIYQKERKSKGRKGRGKAGEVYKPGWLKRDVPPIEPVIEPAGPPVPSALSLLSAPPAEVSSEFSSRRKRDEVEKEVQEDEAHKQGEKAAKGTRQDEHRKLSTVEANNSLTAVELSTMNNSDIVSEGLQKERAVMDEALDRQAIVIPEGDPGDHQDHKGYRLFTNENQHLADHPMTTDSPDVGHMLGCLDHTYSRTDPTASDVIVWRGKLVAPTVSWAALLPESLSIDGRLKMQKAEDYLCGLRWSNTSDVSVLSLTPHDSKESFDATFGYFFSRERYAVVRTGMPPMIKDLNIIPFEVNAKLPEHVEMLYHCTIKKPVEERLLLATLVVARAPDSLPGAIDGTPTRQPVSSLIQQYHTTPRVTEIFGDLLYEPTVQQVLAADPNLDDNRLQNLKALLMDEPSARTDLNVLYALFFSEPLVVLR